MRDASPDLRLAHVDVGPRILEVLTKPEVNLRHAFWRGDDENVAHESEEALVRVNFGPALQSLWFDSLWYELRYATQTQWSAATFSLFEISSTTRRRSVCVWLAFHGAL